jgi:hypothetical protein
MLCRRPCAVIGQAAVRPVGRIIQVGVTGDLPVPLNVAVG